MSANALDAIVLLGDSITQGGWEPNGFAQKLAYVYARKLDVINRGLSGYNTEWTIPVFEQTFAKKEEQPHVPAVRLLTIWFGANDACLRQSPQHVPIDKFAANLSHMIQLLRDPKSPYYSPAPRTHILLITPPPVDEAARAKDLGSRDPPLEVDRTFDNTKAYANAVQEIGEKEGVPVVDAWTLIWEAAKQDPKELPKFLPDGLHLNADAYGLVYEGILKAITEHWPEIHFDNLPPVFPAWDAINWDDPRPSLHSRRVQV